MVTLEVPNLATRVQFPAAVLRSNVDAGLRVNAASDHSRQPYLWLTVLNVSEDIGSRMRAARRLLTLKALLEFVGIFVLGLGAVVLVIVLGRKH